MTATPPLLRRALIVLAVATIAIGTAACEPNTSPPSGPIATSPEARQLLSLVNNFRAANGLGGLVEAYDGTAKAQAHSDEMAAYKTLFHSSSLSSGIANDWTALGENVGVGQTIPQIESMFETSSPHRANLLNGAFDQIGVGVTRGSDGNLYVTEFFIAR
jgi:uncharacterized protein YkwD